MIFYSGNFTEHVQSHRQQNALSFYYNISFPFSQLWYWFGADTCVSSQLSPLMVSGTCWSNVSDRPVVVASLQLDLLPGVTPSQFCRFGFKGNESFPGNGAFQGATMFNIDLVGSDLYILRHGGSLRSALHGRRGRKKAMCCLLYYLWRKCSYRILFYYF